MFQVRTHKSEGLASMHNMSLLKSKSCCCFTIHSCLTLFRLV
uniref:Uncharacterized protein n=1 Tax=Arundo donax TaxID=35708 RepID=A0A0A8ZMW0_ARUDO